MDRLRGNTPTPGNPVYARALDRHAMWAYEFARGEMNAAIEELRLIQALAAELRLPDGGYDDVARS
jgi:hypothetical protein